jgi:hypothetical protein
MHDHHHLPNASLTREGLNVSIEIHHDALSGDVPESIRLDNLRGPLQQFELLGGPAYALGHSDMLRHLCRHTFEPIAQIKRGAVVDIYGYALHFLDDIDWPHIQARDPFVVNTLRCLHYLVPLPVSLQQVAPPPMVPAPAGVGAGMLPLSQALNRHKPAAQVWRALFYPSDWWLHAYYGLAPERRLFVIRWGRHGGRLAVWLLRRLCAALHSRLDRG